MKHTIYFLILNLFAISCHSQDDNRLIKIPVVFHVMYSDSLPDNGINDESRNHGNNTQYLTREKLEAELKDLDLDFQKLNPDVSTVIDEYKNVIGNPNIHFYLSSIIYVRVDKRQIERPMYNSELLHQLSPIVTPSKTLNVYIGEIKFKGGYTNGVTPVKTSVDADQQNDAVNLNYQWVGLGYRLLTHEVGHWVGLWHTWDNNQINATHVTDIPLQTTYTNMPCDKCPPQVRDRIRRHTGFKESNYNNFMDYSGCRKMFSIMQAAVIRKVIKDFRPDIWKN